MRNPKNTKQKSTAKEAMAIKRFFLKVVVFKY